MRAKDYFLVPTELDHDQLGKDISRRHKIAITAILCEMAHVDDHFAREEFEKIIHIIDHQFHLMDNEAEELREIATVLIEDKAKVDEFLDEINQHFDLAQRTHIYKMAVEVAKADGIVDKHEQFFADYVFQRLGLKKAPEDESPI